MQSRTPFLEEVERVAPSFVGSFKALLDEACLARGDLAHSLLKEFLFLLILFPLDFSESVLFDLKLTYTSIDQPSDPVKAPLQISVWG